ncbi:Glu/Leu/Phe/Val dehydrogenase [Shimia thalassica]|uniref:Glu/Leu/Phe/Val family dehydrogenase n=1 Tax=Shimia thalassica TaxID=1715693 RepID=UPI0026E1863B|nr:Glu/Leu/Phe/Val dehydrogenase [Shimia thalassica]MDO6521859.1 Glu/Leu/Phe/Val dehydrogenase [Shimia thalassica]
MNSPLNITHVFAPGHETVLRIEDRATGLIGFIAVHSTALGPAAGGLRMRPYDSQDAAIEDVLRLSRGMTYKNAAAGLPLGGGKAVIMGDPAKLKTPELLRAFARAINTLEGRYWTAEDMGMTPDDMAILAEETRYVAGLADGKFASGDPSPITARGIFQSIQTTAHHRFGTADLAGRVVAVQGLGHVGAHLCKMLHHAGAKLIVTDIDTARIAEAVDAFEAVAADPLGILSVEADILAPCAIGAVLNPATIADLKVAAVCGGANNQLAGDKDGEALHKRGILYAPDYVANAGGIINVATEILEIEDRASFVDQKLAALDDTLNRIFQRATQRNCSPNDVATEIVDEVVTSKAA